MRLVSMSKRKELAGHYSIVNAPNQPYTENVAREMLRNTTDKGANMTQDTIAQMVLANADAISQGVGRITGRANLGADVHADIVADATLALLDKKGRSFDPTKGNPAGFCRMVAYQVALDMLRAMSRGGQFSGAYAGFANANLDASAGGDGEQAQANHAPARNTHEAKEGVVKGHDDSSGRAVRVKGVSLDALGPASFVNELAERQWLADARAAVADVLPELSDWERELWALMSADTFEPASYAEERGITLATAYVRATRLRAKMRDLLAA